jgi:hypothetical protein
MGIFFVLWKPLSSLDQFKLFYFCCSFVIYSSPEKRCFLNNGLFLACQLLDTIFLFSSSAQSYSNIFIVIFC